MRQRQRDPVITEVREVRHHISVRLDDFIRLVSFNMEMKKEYQDRMSETAKHAGPSGQPAA